MQTLDKEKLDILESAIKECGLYATEMQKSVHRMKKNDGSILTEVDLNISHKILSLVAKLFPECAIVSEEEMTEHKKDAPFTFILDPIDGTDVYSLGLPSFAIALGILDKNKKPIGAMINAPRFGIAKESLFVRLDPYGELYVDGEKFEYHKEKNEKAQITMGSKSQKVFDLTKFDGKIRTFGSSVLHLLLPALIPEMKLAIIEPCFVWDITSSNAILNHVGKHIEYVNGEAFEYTDSFIWEKIPFKMPILAGDDEDITELKKTIKYLD